ncbi:copper homeostasis protein [Psychromicrobium silvestre]|uniref:PF03932 family protein CutC n=1 Tax=Psychromicrobium silvestre TaxID=1645614 RepID=A0A7Y9LVJ3_9MICC|nr:copper homeostasis protein CutC [Psychromicrobium silvestre]NYE96315.1 copper homeostasis protein [Psychromicrobium silvestre]
MKLEIAIASAAGAAAAERGGADRVELCSGLELGGLTPSAGLIEAVLEATNLPVQVLLRPRPGDFCYSEDELRTAEREARSLAHQGVTGVVLGALLPGGRVDLETTARLISAVRTIRPGAEIVFHRALDQAVDAVEALEGLAALGVDRVLTSGQASRAAGGVVCLARMVALDSGIEIMAGGGVAPKDIPALAEAGVAAVHLSAKRKATTASSAALALGSADGQDPNAYFLTDEGLVRQAANYCR